MWLKFTSNVSFEMVTDCVAFDYHVAIAVAMIAIYNYWQLSFFLIFTVSRKTPRPILLKFVSNMGWPWIFLMVTMVLLYIQYINIIPLFYF